MLIKVSTYNGEQLEKDMHVNILAKDRQEWLIKHVIWAAAEGYDVQIIRNNTSTEPGDIEKEKAYEEIQQNYRTLHGKA